MITAVRGFNKLAAAMSAVAVMSAGAAAQDSVSVRFKVNADALITAVQSDDTLYIEAAKDETKALKLPLEINVATGVRHTAGARGQSNAPTVTGSRGNITLRLPAQSYSNAEIALYSVNGRRVMSAKADAAQTAKAASRRNLAAGVYLLSVKGIDGSAFTNRLTHSGGNLNINAAFGTDDALRSPARQLGKKAADGEWETKWEITVAGAEEGVYVDSTFTIDLEELLKYDPIPVQNVSLKRVPPPVLTFIDARDDKTYNKVTIGEQTWMAQNLNYRGDDEDNPLGVCYGGLADNCRQYGRMYDWNTAMDGASGTTDNPSGVQGVCPAGWHLPSSSEWVQLRDYVGGASTAGKKLKSASGWSNNSYNGTDEYGFSALPGGYNNGNFTNIGSASVWWSAAEEGSQARFYSINGNSDVLETWPNPKTYIFSVRCVED